MQNEIILSGGTLSETLTEDEENELQIKLWSLLARRTRLFTMGDSSSVRIETAQELFNSICFCLDLYLKQSGNNRRVLLSSDIEILFERSLKAVEEKVELGKRLYKIACSSALRIENISYRDTLISIGGFFRKYDYRFFAHMIPCDIDYQLCHQIEDCFQGIEYINEYLKRLIIENSFVNIFQISHVEQLLEKSCPDYRGLLINIYEPVAVNALGRALLYENVRKLNISPEDRTRLFELFDPLTATPSIRLLNKAALRTCAELGIKDTNAIDYLRKTSEELYPRLNVAISHGFLENVFQTFDVLESHA